MLKIGQPAVMGQLIAGILGQIWPDLQHWLFPAAKEQKAMLEAVSNFGILLLLLLTGMETDLRLVRKFGRAAPLFFGEIAGAVLDKTPASILLVSS